ncbi:hypothetical protein QQG55_57090 [Brugia pahangi]
MITIFQFQLLRIIKSGIASIYMILLFMTWSNGSWRRKEFEELSSIHMKINFYYSLRIIEILIQNCSSA